MPIHVDIKINNTTINTIHIGRIEGDTHPDSVNIYVATTGEKPNTVEQWLQGAKFEHTYGDGAEICVMKAIQALQLNDENSCETFNSSPKMMCGKCGDILISKHVHDYVVCACGESFLDGGGEYSRAGGHIVPAS